MTAKTVRERLRAEITEEIRAVARRHLATDGANLSLRAVARDAGLVPSALYRYFASRDALLTSLITDAYEDLAEVVEAAEAAVPRADVGGRWLALCRAVRAWALDNPAEYALIYGSPVPGYVAPEDTVSPASRVLLMLSSILFDSAGARQQAVSSVRPLPGAVREDLTRLMNRWPGELPQEHGPSSPEAVLAMALTLWTHLFGLVGFEVFGRLNNMIDAREEYFDHQARIVADLAGLATPDDGTDKGTVPA